MTSPRRFEGDLPALLADLYLAGTPEYRDDLVRQTARVRQRPAWTFPERWLPVELVTSRVGATRMPWRQIGVLALIALLIGAILAFYVGSQQNRLPPPFGVADNGLVAYSRDGDIFVVDPDTGTATPIVTGPDIDANPVFSRDGTQVAFLRQWSGPTAFDVVVAGSDGSNPRVVNDKPISLDTVVEWSADSRSLLMTTDTSNVVRFDASGASAPTTVIDAARWVTGELRPPDGRQILFEPDSTPEVDLWIMDADGTNAHLLYKPAQQVESELDQVRWSPDGSMIGFKCAPPGQPDRANICLMDADGGHMRLLTNEGPDMTEADFVWSPDGKRIAFNRWHLGASGSWDIQPIGIASLDDPRVVGVGPAPASEGALFDWSPDGTTILSLSAGYFHSADPAASPSKPLAIDVATGKAQNVSWDIASNVSWQRVAR